MTLAPDNAQAQSRRYVLFQAPTLLFHLWQCVKGGLAVVSGNRDSLHRGRWVLLLGWMVIAAFGDPGTSPAAGGASEHLGELAFGERIAGFYAEPVCSHRCVIVSVGFVASVTMPYVGSSGRLPRMLTLRWPTPRGRITFASAVLAAVQGGDWGGVHHNAARRIFAAMVCRWVASQRRGSADEPDQEFV